MTRLVMLALVSMGVHLGANSQSSQAVGTYKVTAPVNCVVVKNDGGPLAQNNCTFPVYVAYCIDTAMGATDDAKHSRCSVVAQSGGNKLLELHPGKTGRLTGQILPLSSTDSIVQHIAACENPNKIGFGGGQFHETVVFYKLLYSGTGVTASCLTPVPNAKGGKVEKVTNLMRMTGDIRVVSDR